MSTLYSQGASLGNKHKQRDLPKNNKECNLPYLAVGVTVSQFTMVLEGFDLAIVLTNLFLTCNFIWVRLMCILRAHINKSIFGKVLLGIENFFNFR